MLTILGLLIANHIGSYNLDMEETAFLTVCGKSVAALKGRQGVVQCVSEGLRP